MYNLFQSLKNMDRGKAWNMLSVSMIMKYVECKYDYEMPAGEKNLEEKC
jgi:hypothetical protein